jgi:alanine dehydrogenase
MTKLGIGLVREGKVPLDSRVPLAPVSAQFINKNMANIEVVCQSSNHRCYTDQEYLEAGVEVVQDLSNCDILLGVKEVPVNELISNKCYFFFSHTIKTQEYNRDLLQEILAKKITLVDYECLTNSSGNRLVAFGRYAGIVGAYNSIWAYGQRYRLFDIRRAHDCFDLRQLKEEFAKIKLPPMKIVLTGGGRVAKGAMEILNGLGVRRITPAQFIDQIYPGPVYTQLNMRDYHVNKNGNVFNRGEFFADPENYRSSFLQFSSHADILIAGAYWDPRAPVLFTSQDVLKPEFKIKVIADITCDIEGSIPATKKASTIDDPLYDYNPSEDKVEELFTDEANLTVMSIDNLPGELPRDASLDFGKDLIKNVLDHLIGSDMQKVISRATITDQGVLTDNFSYLQDFVDGD